MISWLFTPIDKICTALSGFVISIWKTLFAGKIITEVGFGVFLLNLGFYGVISTAESSSASSFNARIFTCILLRI